MDGKAFVSSEYRAHFNMLRMGVYFSRATLSIGCLLIALQVITAFTNQTARQFAFESVVFFLTAAMFQAISLTERIRILLNMDSQGRRLSEYFMKIESALLFKTLGFLVPTLYMCMLVCTCACLYQIVHIK